MPRNQKHRQPIVDAAVTLFRRQGYASTGLNDIVEKCGAPKGSLYYYFPDGKCSIAVAAVEEAGLRVAKTLHDLTETQETTGDVLKAYAALLTGWMKKSGFRDGCPITTVLLELAPQERAIAQAGRKAYTDQIHVFCEKLIADGYTPDRAKRLARLCVSAMQGALVQARVQKSGEPLEGVAEELATYLDSRK